MRADFTGASRQVPVPVNSTLAVSAASVFIAVKSIFDPDAPLNQGSFRPIEVVAPEGTIVNVTRPAPAGSHGEIRKRVIATMVGALITGRTGRGSRRSCAAARFITCSVVSIRDRARVGPLRMVGGGNGGFAEADGPSAMAPFDWGDLVTVQPSEVIKSRFPLLVEYSELDTDFRRAGALTRRLGDAAADPSHGTGCALFAAFRRRYRAGIRCAWRAKVASRCHHGSRRSTMRSIGFATPGKVGGHLVEEGERVVLRSAGGGGYGDPLERVPGRVARGFPAWIHFGSVAER